MSAVLPLHTFYLMLLSKSSHLTNIIFSVSGTNMKVQRLSLTLSSAFLGAVKQIKSRESCRFLDISFGRRSSLADLSAELWTRSSRLHNGSGMLTSPMKCSQVLRSSDLEKCCVSDLSAQLQEMSCSPDSLVLLC